MTPKFEIQDAAKNESAKELKEKGGGVDLSPKPETVTGMEKSLQKQLDVKKNEVKDSFCEKIKSPEPFSEYLNYKVGVGGNNYTLKLEHLEVDGTKVDKKDYGNLGKSIEKGEVDLDRVGGSFSMEGKDGGIKLQYSLSAATMVKPEGIKERLVNDFSGGADKFKKENLIQEVKAEKPKVESAAEKNNKDNQVEETKKMARTAGGEASILSGEGVTLINITFPKGRQLKISTTTGAVWSCEETETENGRKTSRGSKATPMEFLLSGEKDPGT